MLCAYDYDIKFKSTKEHCNADMLSRLPVPTDSNPSPNPINAMQIDFLPVTANQMQKATKEDRVLKLISEYCRKGVVWSCSDIISPELKRYFDKRNELSIENRILLLGLRVVIPLKY